MPNYIYTKGTATNTAFNQNDVYMLFQQQVKSEYSLLPVAKPMWTMDDWKEWFNEDPSRLEDEEIQDKVRKAKSYAFKLPYQCLIQAYQELAYYEGV